MMKIEAGKFYRMRNGQKAGPAKRAADYHVVDGFPWSLNGTYVYTGFGIAGDGSHPEYDLMSEWSDPPRQPSPVVVETRKRIIPGVYGTIQVSLFDGEDGVYINAGPSLWEASELRAAAATLAEIADALDEGAR